MDIGTGLVIVGAAIAVLGSSLSAFGHGIVASAASRSLENKPRLFGKTLILSALPGTQSVYGLLVAILLLSASGLLTGSPKEIPLGVGLMCLGAGLAIGLSAPISAIMQGMVASGGVGSIVENEKIFDKSLVLAAITETQAIYGLLVAVLLISFSGLLSKTVAELPIGVGMMGVAAGVAIGISAAGSVSGQGMAASAAMGVVAEKEKAFAKGLVFSALPETQAIYGLLVAILLVTFSGLMGVVQQIPIWTGLATLGTSFVIGLAAFSAIGQGIAASRGVSNVAKYEKSFGRSMTLSAICETQAIYGLLTAVLIIAGLGLFAGELRTITLIMGCGIVATGIMMGFVSGQSAIGQGIVAASSIDVSARDEKAFGKTLSFTILPETQAIYALLIVILILLSLHML